jgi:hypothetical protein
MAGIIASPKTIVAKVDFGSSSISSYYNNPASTWNGAAYTYSVTLTVIPQSTGDEFSQPTAFQYDGLNISVGDWIGQQNGLCFQISQINSATSTSVVCILKDVDVFNLVISGGNSPVEDQYGVIFNLGDDGTPVIDPTELQRGQFGNVNYWLNDLYGRFTYRNYLEDYYGIAIETGTQGATGYTGFSLGDFVYLGPDSRFYQADSSIASEVEKVFGVVTAVDTPEDGDLGVRPFGRIFSNLPLLPGATGDVLYFDSGATATNQLTSVKPTSNIFPTYIKMGPNAGLLLTSHSDVGGGGTGTG